MTKKLYIIDGANYVYRAFYAIPSLTNSKGLPTNALYGFTQMLLALVREEKPDYMVIAFDTKEPTFRDEMYAEYKANRKAPPDDLIPQFPYIRPLVDALGIASIEKPGFEADDVIGTLVTRCASEDLEISIVSGDKDLMQLVGPRVSMLDTMKGIRFGPMQVEERFGVPPEKVIEVLALMGDSSDNVPGLPGIGPKTATKLIQEYGSVDHLIAIADDLAEGLRDKIVTHEKMLRMCKELVTIKC
ncbi:MAG: DNA polymerase I, partial [Deltaproteobacteria bacterium]|nr:DNA polymerase I [Deltaproteobacteria bacterium]